MDPNYNDPRYLNNGERTSGRRNISGYDHSNEKANDNGNAATAASTAQETNSQTPIGVTKIPPNVSRWNKLKTMAQKEEEEFQRWREANRPSSVYEPPERTGGHASMEEARQKQVVDFRRSKLQKKLKREELDRRRRQEEEEEQEKMKAKAREKAERLEQRKRQEEARRRSELKEDQLRSTENFLQKLERKGPAPVASSSATHASSWLRAQDQRERQREEENSALQMKKEEQRKKSEALEQKQSKNYEERSREVQLDHRRVNSAFLDKIEGRDRASGTSQMEERREGRCSSWSLEDLSIQEAHRPEPQEDPPTRPDSYPGQCSSDWATEADSEPDLERALMRLESTFSYCDRGFLEDILTQCNGDYQQANALLSATMNLI